jgi:Trk K+ transport system NAD-binding subunit
MVAAAGRRIQGRLLNPGAAARDARPHFVVCGDDVLARRLVEELVVQYGRSVTVIVPSRTSRHGPEIDRIPGVRLIEAERLDTDAFDRAGVRSAASLALVAQDDVGNLHAALQAQELNPDLRLVIRMFNMSLGYGIRALFKDCRVLSDASIAAPAFVASAFGEVAPSYVRLAGRTLFVARRTEVPAPDVICGLADTSGGGEPDLLPTEESRCDLVLAKANGRFQPAGLDQDGLTMVPNRKRRRRLQPGAWWRQFASGSLTGGVLRVAALALLAVLVVGTGLLALTNDQLSVWQAFYLTVLDTVGGVNPDLAAGGATQVIQVVVMLAGIAMVPVITAAVVEAVVNARLALALGRLRGPIEDHVVVVGLGNVGTRVIQQLHDLGIPVVAIDKSDAARGAQLARDLGVPLLIGDASRVETLNQASVERARALLALSTDDVINLEAALHARTFNKDLRVVLRLFDGDFADRVQRAFGITSSKSVSFLAVPAFTAAMLEREVIGTIPVRRRVLLVAEVPVVVGSPLDGATVADAQHSGEARVIALTSGEYRDAQWSPPPERRLNPGDLLVVVATRRGLTQMLGQSQPVPVEPAAG